MRIRIDHRHLLVSISSVPITRVTSSIVCAAWMPIPISKRHKNVSIAVFWRLPDHSQRDSEMWDPTDRQPSRSVFNFQLIWPAVTVSSNGNTPQPTIGAQIQSLVNQVWAWAWRMKHSLAVRTFPSLLTVHLWTHPHPWSFLSKLRVYSETSQTALCLLVLAPHQQPLNPRPLQPLDPQVVQRLGHPTVFCTE